jgi:hypothetical protein
LPAAAFQEPLFDVSSLASFRGGFEKDGLICEIVASECTLCKRMSNVAVGRSAFQLPFSSLYAFSAHFSRITLHFGGAAGRQKEMASAPSAFRLLSPGPKFNQAKSPPPPPRAAVFAIVLFRSATVRFIRVTLLYRP